MSVSVGREVGEEKDEGNLDESCVQENSLILFHRQLILLARHVYLCYEKTSTNTMEHNGTQCFVHTSC